MKDKRGKSNITKIMEEADCNKSNEFIKKRMNSSSIHLRNGYFKNLKEKNMKKVYSIYTENESNQE